MKFNSIYFASLAVLILPVALPAATISIQTTCQPYGQPLIVTNNGCVAGTPTPSFDGGLVSARGSLSFALAPSAADWSTLQMSATALAQLAKVGPDPNPVYYSTQALAQVALSGLFTTTGPVRSGFVQLQTDGYGGNGPGDGSGSGVIEIGSSVELPNITIPNHLFDFTLGEAFSIHYMGQANAYSDPAVEGPGYGDTATTIHFRFLEADGLTPVAVSEVTTAPEPSTLALLGLSLLSFR